MSDENIPADDDEADVKPEPIETVLDLELITPVKFGKETHTVLHLSEPTMKQLRAAQRGQTAADQLAIMIQENTGLLPGVVDKLSQRDVKACDDFFGRFSGA